MPRVPAAAWATVAVYGQDYKSGSWLEQRRTGYIAAARTAQAPEQAWKHRS